MLRSSGVIVSLLICSCLICGGCSWQGFVLKQVAKKAYSEYKEANQHQKQRQKQLEATSLRMLNKDVFLVETDGLATLQPPSAWQKTVPSSISAYGKSPEKWPAVKGVVSAGTVIDTAGQDISTGRITNGPYDGTIVQLDKVKTGLDPVQQ